MKPARSIKYFATRIHGLTNAKHLRPNQMSYGLGASGRLVVWCRRADARSALSVNSTSPTLVDRFEVGLVQFTAVGLTRPHASVKPPSVLAARCPAPGP